MLNKIVVLAVVLFLGVMAANAGAHVLMQTTPTGSHETLPNSDSTPTPTTTPTTAPTPTPTEEPSPEPTVMAIVPAKPTETPEKEQEIPQTPEHESNSGGD